MRAHPEYVCGEQSEVTGLMRAVPGLLLKDGAESVYARRPAGWPGRGGEDRPTAGSGPARPVLVAALAALGAASEPASTRRRWSGGATVPVLGHGAAGRPDPPLVGCSLHRRRRRAERCSPFRPYPTVKSDISPEILSRRSSVTPLSPEGISGAGVCPPWLMGVFMRTWGNGIAGKAMAPLRSLLPSLIGQPLTASAAPGPLTITPLGWNVIGLDSNNVNAGPNVFPVGGRVCNTGCDPVTNVAVNWNWLSSNTYVNLTNTTSFSTASLGAGACRDYYFNVEVTRNSSAYNTARAVPGRRATGDSVSAVSTPTNREIYVEKLVSQNRNAVTGSALVNNPAAGCIAATETVYVGSTCTVNITAKTAPGGYEQLVTAFYFNNSMFQIESFTASYPTPAG